LDIVEEDGLGSCVVVVVGLSGVLHEQLVLGVLVALSLGGV